MCGEGWADPVAAMDAIDVEGCGRSTATMAAALRAYERLGARLAGEVAQFDSSGVWGEDGSTSALASLKHHACQHRGDSQRWVKTGRLLARVPELAERARDGRLSAGQIRAIVDNVSDRTVDLFAEHAADLLPVLEPLSAADTAVAMQVWRSRADAILDGPEPKPERRREFHMTRGDDGCWVGRFTLDDEAGAIVSRGLELAKTKDCDGEPVRSPARQRADAFVDTFQFSLDHHDSPASGRNRPHVGMLVRWEGGPLAPARFDDDLVARADLIARYLCDARVHRYLVDAESAILDYGRSQRTVSTALFRVLVTRDQHCRWPGCSRPPAWCHAHHVVPWEAGGPTDLDNLVLLCSRHHHLVHEGGFQLKLLPDREVHITSPHGQLLISKSPPIIRC